MIGSRRFYDFLWDVKPGKIYPFNKDGDSPIRKHNNQVLKFYELSKLMSLNVRSSRFQFATPIESEHFALFVLKEYENFQIIKIYGVNDQKFVSRPCVVLFGD